METSLLSICGIAFVAVLVILTGLAAMIRLLTAVFPDESPEADKGLMQAINTAVHTAFPGSLVVRVEVEKSEEG